MNAIDANLIDETKQLSQKVSEMENIITNRIDYIVKTIYKVFSNKLAHWYFNGACEGQIGPLWKNYSNENINLVFEATRDRNYNYNYKEMTIIDKFGSEYGFDSSIPTRWLFDNEFESELINGKIAFEKRKHELMAAQTSEFNLKKAKNKKLVAAAKEKLSKEELAALLGK